MASEQPSRQLADWALFCVTLLTGRRPTLFERTVRALTDNAPGLLESATVICYHNGGDRKTAELIKRYEFIDQLRTKRIGIDGIGNATSWLMGEAYRSDRPFTLHVEDDWELTDGGQLEQALSILAKHDDIGQVRLRLLKEKVASTHQITNQELLWTNRAGYRTANAHFTFQANLIRTRDIPKIFPARNEPDAQRNLMKHFNLVAQLDPGCFSDIGDEDSLRLRTRNPESLAVSERLKEKVPPRVRDWLRRHEKVKRLLGRR
jgi:hypothetical protein